MANLDMEPLNAAPVAAFFFQPPFTRRAPGARVVHFVRPTAAKTDGKSPAASIRPASSGFNGEKVNMVSADEQNTMQKRLLKALTLDANKRFLPWCRIWPSAVPPGSLTPVTF